MFFVSSSVVVQSLCCLNILNVILSLLLMKTTFHKRERERAALVQSNLRTHTHTHTHAHTHTHTRTYAHISIRRSKTNISLVPRAVTRKTESAPGNQQDLESSAAQGGKESNVAKMSNDDFRKLLSK